MAYDQKKYPDVVSEQPGSTQKKVDSKQKKSRLKNEMANNTHETSLDHPSCSYETYKRRCE